MGGNSDDAYTDADSPNEPPIDIRTGEVMTLPTSDWLMQHAIFPYWMAQFPFETMMEVYDDADDTVPSGLTPPEPNIGLEFRYGSGEKIVVGLAVDVARDFALLVLATCDRLQQHG